MKTNLKINLKNPPQKKPELLTQVFLFYTENIYSLIGIIASIALNNSTLDVALFKI
jgi:hypothetical protein